MPLVVVAALGIVAVAGIVRDQLAVELAAREGARAAAVSAAPAAAAAAAATASTGVGPLTTSTAVTASDVAVTVRYSSTVSVPLIGLVIDDIDVVATVTMAREPPP